MPVGAHQVWCTCNTVIIHWVAVFQHDLLTQNECCATVTANCKPNLPAQIKSAKTEALQNLTVCWMHSDGISFYSFFFFFKRMSNIKRLFLPDQHDGASFNIRHASWEATGNQNTDKAVTHPLKDKSNQNWKSLSLAAIVKDFCFKGALRSFGEILTQNFKMYNINDVT